MEYTINGPAEAAETAELFRQSGLRRPVDDLERIGRMLNNADVTITARHKGRLVGIVRAVTDYSYCCYISDLAVDRACQGQGIGRELIRLLREKLGDEVSYVLTSAPQAVEFYPRVGFDKAEKAFWIRRKR